MADVFVSGLIFFCLLVISVLQFGLRGYLSEKLKAFATKQDAIDLASSIEAMKVNMGELSGIAAQTRALKYEACLGAMAVIDAHLSNIFALENAVSQPPDTIFARKIHNKLILSCDNPELVLKFSEIYFGPVSGQPAVPQTELLREFRSMVRAELGFGKMLLSDAERTWIARAAGDVVSKKPGYEGVE
jgi:hypothetical protein